MVAGHIDSHPRRLPLNRFQACVQAEGAQDLTLDEYSHTTLKQAKELSSRVFQLQDILPYSSEQHQQAAVAHPSVEFRIDFPAPSAREPGFGIKVRRVRWWPS